MNRAQVIERLSACADDPMWANHAEVNKATLRAAVEHLSSEEQPQTADTAGAPGATDAERAAWLADKIVAGGDYAKEAAKMLRRWPKQ